MEALGSKPYELLAKRLSTPISMFEDGSAFGLTNFRLVAITACLVTFGLSTEILLSVEVQMAALANIGVGMLAALWGPKG